jgi:hypothetical protein
VFSVPAQERYREPIKGKRTDKLSDVKSRLPQIDFNVL